METYEIYGTYRTDKIYETYGTYGIYGTYDLWDLWDLSFLCPLVVSVRTVLAIPTQHPKIKVVNPMRKNTFLRFAWIYNVGVKPRRQGVPTNDKIGTVIYHVTISKLTRQGYPKSHSSGLSP